MKRLSTRRAKALAIPAKAKEAVYKRDKGMCVLCGKPGNPEAHFISRAHGGLGIEQNILTLCRECHGRFDGGADRRQLASLFWDYLRSKYPGLKTESLVYRK